MKKILIMGGSGFIGLQIVSRLCNQGGYEVTIADNFFRGKFDDELSALTSQFDIKIIKADFTDRDSFDQLGEYDNFYMLASVVGVKYTEDMPHELIRINSFLILNTLEWLKRSRVNRVLFTSTSECYAGTIDEFNYPVPTNEDVPLCVKDVSHPRFTYAITKMLGESGFLNYSKKFGFDCNIVRYHNVYGPRMGFRHVIPQVIKRFMDGEAPFEIISYNQTRSFNYINDAVTATIACQETEDINNEIFHIGTQEEISIEELVKYIGTVLKYQGTYTYKNAPSGSVKRRCPDITKARKLLGYEPAIHWQDGVLRTIEWYRNFYSNGGIAFE